MQITLTVIGGFFASNHKLILDTKDIKRLEENSDGTTVTTTDNKEFSVKETADEIQKLSNKTAEAKA